MRKSSFFKILFVLVAFAGLASCKKDNDGPAKVAFNSFKFTAAANEGLTADINGIITGDDITIRVPNAVDITKLVASFDLSDANTIVKANDVVQVSGETELDFSQAITYTLTSANGTKTYEIKAVRDASFASFGFYKEDNPGVLFKDYPATITGLEVDVKVPLDVNVTELVARYETTPNAVVKVGGTVQTSKVDKHDYSNSVTFALTDPETTTPQNFIVTVGRLTAPEWIKIGDESIIVPTADGLKLAINPVTNQPYVAYRLSGVDAGGVSIPTADRKMAVVAYNGTSWTHLGGANGFSEGEAREPQIAFETNGTPYVAYKDYIESAQKTTVMKYSNDAWSLVGSSRFTPIKSDYLSFGISPDNVPYVAMGKGSGTDLPSLERRGLYIMNYVSGNWAAANPPAGVLVSNTNLVRAGDKFYLGVVDRTTGKQKLTVYQLVNNQWTVLGQSGFPVEDKYAYLKMDLAVGVNGGIYVAYQDASVTSDRKNNVLKFNGTSWEDIGSPISVASERDNFSIAVHPNGTLYMAYGDGNNLYARTFNNTTNAWNAATTVITGGVSEFDMKISNDGIPYIAASLDANDKTVVFKFDIP